MQTQNSKWRQFSFGPAINNQPSQVLDKVPYYTRVQFRDADLSHNGVHPTFV